MGIKDIKAIVAAAVASALSEGGAMKLTTTAEAPAVKTGKRKGNPEALKKWRESQKTAKPAAKPAAKTVKPAKPAVKAVAADAPAWTCEPYTTKRGVEGKLIKVGCWSTFIREGNEQAAIDSINTVFRSAAATALVAAIRG